MLKILQNATKTKKAHEHSLCIQRKCAHILQKRMQWRIALECNAILMFGILVHHICINDISCF